MSAVKPKIPNFQITEICGQGGSCTVWLGIDTDGIKRAIRTIDIESLPKERIEREVTAISLYRNVSVQHKNLLDILYIGKTARYLYYVTPLADNATEYARRYRPDTLALRIKNGQYTDRELFEYLHDLLNGVECLHSHQIAHRDLKPDNIIFVNRELKIADPGLTSFSQTGSNAGTNGYLPPWPDATGVESDIFAIGKIIYCLLTGNDATQYPELTENLKSERAAALNEIALRCCPSQKEQQFRSVAQIREALDRITLPRTAVLWDHLRRRGMAILTVSLLISLGFNLYPLRPKLKSTLPLKTGEQLFLKLKLDFGGANVIAIHDATEQLAKLCPALEKYEDFRMFRKQVSDNHNWLTFMALPDHVLQTLPLTSSLKLPVPAQTRIDAFERYFSLCENMEIYPPLLYEYYAFMKKMGKTEKANRLKSMLAALTGKECNVVALSYACMRMSNFQAHAGEYDEALLFAQKAQEATPNIYAVYVLLFQAHFLNENYNESERMLQQLRRIQPDSIFLESCSKMQQNPAAYKTVRNADDDQRKYPLSLSDRLIDVPPSQKSEQR